MFDFSCFDFTRPRSMSGHGVHMTDAGENKEGPGKYEIKEK